jgi:nicotinamidase/pyrazinamidase
LRARPEKRSTGAPQDFLDRSGRVSYTFWDKFLRKTTGGKMDIGKTDALLIIDVQNDFVSGGSLAVLGGDRVVPVINRIAGRFETRVFTRDWHPADHISFSGEPHRTDHSWPAHCVQNTHGAEFHPDLIVKPEDRIVSLGVGSQEENYSGFHGTDLEGWLQERGIHRIFIAGLTTEYCVFTTAMDGLVAGFQVVVLEDAIAGVNVPAGSAEKALQTLKQSGVSILSSDELAS